MGLGTWFFLFQGARMLRFQPLIFRGVCQQNTFSSIEWTLKIEPPSQLFSHHFPYDWCWWPAIQPQKSPGARQTLCRASAWPFRPSGPVIVVQPWGWTAAVSRWVPDVFFWFQEIQQGGVYMRAIQEGLNFWKKMPTWNFSFFLGGMLMSKFRKVSVSAFYSLYQPPQPCQAERPQQPEWPTRLKRMERWMWILRWRT